MKVVCPNCGIDVETCWPEEYHIGSMNTDKCEDGCGKWFAFYLSLDAEITYYTLTEVTK